MIQAKTLINKTNALAALQVFILAGVIIIAPLFKQQLITGPLVNAILFISVVLTGTSNAMLVALIPSVVSLAVGLLPPVLAPMIPFIMLSNVILVQVFNWLREKNFWLAMVTASVAKFAFLYACTSVVINLLLKKEVATQVATMLSWPQLLTALVGGVVAFGILKGLKKI